MAAGEDTSHILSGLTNQLPDRDPEETAEWVESLDSLIREQGTERAQFIMRSLLQRAGAQSVGLMDRPEAALAVPQRASTPSARWAEGADIVVTSCALVTPTGVGVCMGNSNSGGFRGGEP